MLTRDGLHLSKTGHWLSGVASLERLGITYRLPAYEPKDWGPLSDFGLTWRQEQLRQFILAKNRLWFDYWRPQNWAFLNGDRTDQPSSRDHRDPKRRWFPEEMEKFLPLIEAKEKEIWILAAELSAKLP